MASPHILVVQPVSQHACDRFVRASKSLKAQVSLLTVAEPPFNLDQNDFSRVIFIEGLSDDIPSDLDLQFLKALKISAVVPGSEFAVPLSERLSKSLGLFYNDLSHVLALRNKREMRRLFDKENVPQPKVIEAVHSMMELDGIDFTQIEFPVIVKPSDLAGSINVKLCYSESEVRDAVVPILAYKTSVAIGLAFEGCALIEQAAIGEEFSLECVIFDSEIVYSSITQKLLAPLPFRDEVGHVVGDLYWPEEQRKDADGLARKIASAWKITRGVMHVEFKRAGNGTLSVIEAAPRVAGDQISELVELRYGVNLEKTLCKLRLGGAPTFTKIPDHLPEFVAIRFLFDDSKELKSCASFELMRCVKSAANASISGGPYNVSRRAGFQLLRGHSREDLVSSCSVLSE